MVNPSTNKRAFLVIRTKVGELECCGAQSHCPYCCAIPIAEGIKHTVIPFLLRHYLQREYSRRRPPATIQFNMLKKIQPFFPRAGRGAVGRRLLSNRCKDNKKPPPARGGSLQSPTHATSPHFLSNMYPWSCSIPTPKPSITPTRHSIFQWV